MLAWRSLLVYPLDNGKYIIIGGNMRFQALQELGHTAAPCYIIPRETSVERLQAYAILDNNSFGEWDWNLLSSGWESMSLDDWGIDTWEMADAMQNEEIKSATDEGTVAKQRNLLQFNGYKIQMTDAEMEGLNSIFEDYVDKSGGYYGFVTYVIEKFSEIEDGED